MLRALIAKLWMPTSDFRFVCVPDWFLSMLRETAMNELGESKSGSTNGDDSNKAEESRFIGKSDILLAWKSRTIHSTINPSPKNQLPFLTLSACSRSSQTFFPQTQRTLVRNNGL